MLRAILASQQPNRCKQAQAFISTQGLEPDTVAELVAEEVTRELLSPSEGAGTLSSRPPGLSDHFHKFPVLWMICSYTSRVLPSQVARLHLLEEHIAFVL